MFLGELAEVWLDSIRESVRETTLASYRVAVKRAVRYLGGKDIQDITEQDLRDTETRLVANGDSYQTARMMFNVLRLSLDCAVKEGRLSANPAKYYTPDKGSYRKAKETRAVSAPDAERIIKQYPFLHPYHMPLMLLYGAGLRTGEMLGLTWDHVDLKYGCIHIVRQLVHRKGGRYGFTPLRSASLVRDVVIDGRLKSQLSRWRSDQKMRGLLKRGEKDAFVCIETDGSPINYDRFVYTLRKQGVTPRFLRKAYEDQANETAAILKERLSMEEIGILRRQMLRRENGTSEEAFSLPLEGKVAADRLTDKVGIA